VEIKITRIRAEILNMGCIDLYY